MRPADAPAEPAGPAPPRGMPWALVLGATCAFSFVFGLRLIGDNNVGFHLHGGRWIVEHLAFPDRDAYTYTVAANRYVDLHWLFQVVLYGLHRLGGGAALSVANAVLAALLTLVLGLRMRRAGAEPGVAAWVLLVSTLIMGLRSLMRPENVTYLYLALLCLVLDRYCSGRPSPGAAVAARPAALRLLWPVPLIHLLWVNTQGLFILGLAVTGTYWVSASFRARRPDRPLAIAGVAAAAASLVNPYFLEGFLFPLQLLNRSDRANVFAQQILELRPVWSFSGFLEDRLLYGFVAALVAALLLSRDRRSPHEFLLPALFLPLSFSAVRNVPLLVVVAAPTLAAAVTDVGRRFAGGRAAVLWPRLQGPALLGMVLLLAVRVVTNAYYTVPGLDAEFRFGAGIDRGLQPAAAGEFLVRHGLRGRVLNSTAIGGWLGWVLPQPVFGDGRLEVIREELFQEEVDSWGEDGLSPLLEKYRPELVVFDHRAAAGAWLPQLHGREDWRLIHVDEVAAVYARRGYAPEIPEIDPSSLPGASGVGAAPTETRIRRVLMRPVPGRLRRWLAGFTAPQFPDDADAVLGHFCEKIGAPGAAEQFYLACLERTPDLSYDTFGSLGLLYVVSGRPDLAVPCYDQQLRYEPGNAVLHNERGIARVEAGDGAGAVRDFSRAIELDAGVAPFHYNRALAHQRLGRLDLAEVDYRRALELDPRHAGARQGLEVVRGATR